MKLKAMTLWMALTTLICGGQLILAEDSNVNVNQKSIREVVEEYEYSNSYTDENGKLTSKKNKSKRPKVVGFFDETGKVVKEIQLNVVSGDALRVDKYESIFPVYSKNKTFVAIARKVSIRNSTETYRNTGWMRDDAVTIQYYDNTGTMLFEKTTGGCVPVMVSDSGERVVCVRYMPDSVEMHGMTLEAEKNLKSKLIILSKNGDILVSKEVRFMNFDSYLVSSSGKWLIYKTNDSTIFHLLDTDTNQELSFSWSKFMPMSIYAISDDGGVMLQNFIGEDEKGRGKFKVAIYYPQTNKMEDKGEEAR